jgi:transposase
VEGAVGRLKQLRRVATDHEKRTCNYLAMVKLAAVLVWPRPVHHSRAGG